MRAWIYDQIEGGSKQTFDLDTYPSLTWKRDPAIHCLHTTEGTGFPSAATYKMGGSAPHFTIHPKLRQTRQHLPLTGGAYALAYKGRSTNTMGVIQYEVVGYAKDTDDLTDDDLAYIAHVLKTVGDETGIAATCGVDFGGVEGYGVEGRYRLDYDDFAAYTGVLGHAHVPDNSHWDPGAFPIDKLLELMGGTVEVGKPVTPTTPPVKEPTSDGMTSLGDKGTQVGRDQRELRRTGWYTGEIDNWCGPVMDEAIYGFQFAAAIKTDRKFGPISRATCDRVPNFNGTTRQGDKGTGRTLPFQQRLKRIARYLGKLDDWHGTLTTKAMLAAQKAFGITEDGVGGRQTWTSLFTR